MAPWLAAFVAGGGAFVGSRLVHPSAVTAIGACAATIVAFVALLELLSRLRLAAASPSPREIFRRLSAAIGPTAAKPGSVVTVDARAS
jgi:hypothetical protein